MNDEVRQELRGAALWVTIDRTARRNAINAQVIAGLEQALERARAMVRADHPAKSVKELVAC